MAYNPTGISSLAATVVPYEAVRPLAYKWVSPTGSDANPGTQTAPLKTIQSAVNAASPGTAVMVKEGVYKENVKLAKSGYADKPIWLASADGAGKADIVAANTGLPPVYGFGVDNLVIKGFELVGGPEGIKLTQSGSNFSNVVSNVVIENNTIHGQTTDGIKTAQTLNAAVTGNTVYGVRGQEGIDNVYMRNGVIAHNKVSDIAGTSGIVAKSGSDNVKILKNEVHSVPDGILAGGYSSGQGTIFPTGINYELRNSLIQDNLVTNASKQAVNAYGAHNTVIDDNHLSVTGTPAVVNVNKDNLGYVSKGVQITDNIVSKSAWLTAAAGAVSVNTGNATTGTFDKTQVGPATMTLYSQPYSAPVMPREPSDIPVDSRTYDWKDGAATTTIIRGTSGADTLKGTTGHDLIDGGAYHDTMTGGTGDDRYVISSPYDKVIEYGYGGRDTVNLWTSYAMPANVQNAVIHTGAGARVTDNGIDNILTGGSGPDTFTFVANHGHDLIRGFKVGTDHLKMPVALADLDVAQTPNGDMVVQHGLQSVTLLGVDPHTSLGSLL